MLRRSNQYSSLAALLASTVVKFGAPGWSNCGFAMSDVVRQDIFSIPVSSIPNVPAVYTSVSSACEPATKGPVGVSAIEPMCSGR
jgi:hypothetical protein